jgi:hypothetical protein
MHSSLDNATAIAKIKAKIGQITELKMLPRSCPQFMKWYRETNVLLERIFGAGSNRINDFLAIEFTYRDAYAAGDMGPFERRYRSALEDQPMWTLSIQSKDHQPATHAQRLNARPTLSYNSAWSHDPPVRL